MASDDKGMALPVDDLAGLRIADGMRILEADKHIGGKHAVVADDKLAPAAREYLHPFSGSVAAHGYAGAIPLADKNMQPFEVTIFKNLHSRVVALAHDGGAEKRCPWMEDEPVP